MSAVPNYASTFMTQRRDMNGGGFASGAATAKGMYGRLPIGKGGKVIGGVADTNPGLIARLVLHDEAGGEHIISDHDITLPSSQFVQDDGIQDNIPEGATISVKIMAHGGGNTYWFLCTS